jgi:Icc-related predicted phosphoesterase
MRIAAAADVHAREGQVERIEEMFGNVHTEADVLVLAGDLTDHGRPAEVETLLQGLHCVEVPIIAVLGNHDHEAGWTADLRRMLTAGGIHLLERASLVLDDVGFAGAKGFAGGFANRLVRGFGEDALKAFVSESVVEAEGLRSALMGLKGVGKRVVVTHYSPVVETLQGEPAEIHPFLGTSRLEAAIDQGKADLAIHGHAHHGSMRGKTSGGVPVWNVSLPVLRAAGVTKTYQVLEV